MSDRVEDSAILRAQGLAVGYDGAPLVSGIDLAVGLRHLGKDAEQTPQEHVLPALQPFSERIIPHTSPSVSFLVFN